MMPNERARPVGDASAMPVDALDGRTVRRDGSSRPDRRCAPSTVDREIPRAQREQRGPDRLVGIPLRRPTAAPARGPARPADSVALARAQRATVGGRAAASTHARKSGDRREGHEAAELGEVEAQRFDDLFDERRAEVHAGQAGLAVRDRIEDRGVGAFEVELRAPARRAAAGARSRCRRSSAISTNTSGSSGIAGWKNA